MKRALLISLLMVATVAVGDLDHENLHDYDLNVLWGELIQAVNERCYALFRDHQMIDGERVERYWVDPILTNNLYEVAWDPAGSMIELTWPTIGTNTVTGNVLAFEYEQGQEPDGWIWVDSIRFEVVPNQPLRRYVSSGRPVLFRPASGNWMIPLYRVGFGSVSPVDLRAEVINRVNRLLGEGFYMDPEDPEQQLETQLEPRMVNRGFGWQYVYYWYGEDGDWFNPQVCIGSPCPGTQHGDYLHIPDWSGFPGTVDIVAETNVVVQAGWIKPMRLFTLDMDSVMTNNPLGSVGRGVQWTNSYTSSSFGGARDEVFTAWSITNHAFYGSYGDTNAPDGIVPAFDILLRPHVTWSVVVTNSAGEVQITDNQSFRLDVVNHGVLNARAGDQNVGLLFRSHSVDELEDERYWVKYYPALNQEHEPIDLPDIPFDLNMTYQRIFDQESFSLRRVMNETVSTNLNVLDYVGSGYQLLEYGYSINSLAIANVQTTAVSRVRPEPWPDFPVGARWTVWTRPLPELSWLDNRPGGGSTGAPLEPGIIVDLWRIISRMQQTRLTSYGHIPGRIDVRQNFDGTATTNAYIIRVDSQHAHTNTYSLIDYRAPAQYIPIDSTLSVVPVNPDTGWSGYWNTPPSAWRVVLENRLNRRTTVQPDPIGTRVTENSTRSTLNGAFNAYKSERVAGKLTLYLMRRQARTSPGLENYYDVSGVTLWSGVDAPIYQQSIAYYEVNEETWPAFESQVEIETTSIPVTWSVPIPDPGPTYTLSGSLSGPTEVTVEGRSRHHAYFHDVVWQWDFNHPVLPE